MVRRIAVKLILASLVLAIFSPFSGNASAQEQKNLTLSITPPLIKNKVEPGQVWKSSVKIVNNNDEPVTVYVQIADFRGKAENGTVQFLDKTEISGGADDYLLSKWITLETESISIGPQSSQSIPFVVEVPEKAEPGGHYAAILAGTQPPREQVEGATIRVSSLLASLMLLSVKGETREEGRIREFSTNQEFYTTPDVKFAVRFQNTGNIHIQPQGEIRIYDQWGKEKGALTINHRTEFGNVLPGGTRKWEFDWKGEREFFNMGRYRADLVLGYGEEARRTENRSIYFWVIYLKPLLISVGSLLVLILLLVFFIRLYVKRAIERTHARLSDFERNSAHQAKNGSTKKNMRSMKKGDGGDEKVLNLRYSSEQPPDGAGRDRRFASWRFFKIILALFFLSALGAGAWITGEQYGLWQDEETIEATQGGYNGNNKSGKESLNKSDNTKKTPKNASSSDIRQATSTEPAEKNRSELDIQVLNGSGQGGLAGQAERFLGEENYAISNIDNAESFDYATTTVVYKKDELRNDARDIGDYLGVKPVLRRESQDLNYDIVIILGNDFADNL